MNQCANFDVLLKESTSNSVTIRDVGPWDRFPTVTNAVEEVVERLFKMGALKPGQRLFYYDSDGNLDEILVQNGEFAGFLVGKRERKEG